MRSPREQVDGEREAGPRRCPVMRARGAQSTPELARPLAVTSLHMSSDRVADGFESLLRSVRDYLSTALPQIMQEL